MLPPLAIRKTKMMRLNDPFGARRLRAIVLAILLTGMSVVPVWSQVPDLATGKIPTLAPLVREVTPAVVNISVHGKVREDNPLYKDPLFREFFEMPKQLEKEVSATGSGVIVDAQKGYVLTANHVVEKISTAQITTKDGRKFNAKVVGRDPRNRHRCSANSKCYGPEVHPHG